MPWKEHLVVVLLAAIFALTQGHAGCPECVNGNYDCSNIYPKCGPKVNNLCFYQGIYYCAEPKMCPECTLPGHKCEKYHPYCNKETTVGLCYEAGKLICVEKVVPTTAAPPLPVPTTPKPTTPAPTTAAPITVAPRNRCLTPGLTSGCFLQCPSTWIPLIGKSCLEGTCCTRIP